MDDSSEDELHDVTSDFSIAAPGFTYTDPFSFSGVIKAVIMNHLEGLEDLIKKGKSINVVDNHGNTALHVSAYLNRIKFIERILKVPDVSINSKNHYGGTPLLLAVKESNDEAAFLLLKGGADANIANNELVTPLHYAARKSSKLSLELLRHNANPYAQDYCLDTPLHEAVSHSQTEIVAMLLYFDADPNILCANNLTPFMMSLLVDKRDIQDILFEYTVDFNQTTKDNMSLLLIALSHNSPYVADIIERGGDVNYNANEQFNAITVIHDIDLPVFRLIWEKFDYVQCWKSEVNILIYLLNYIHPIQKCLQLMQVVLESDKIADVASISKPVPLITLLAYKFFTEKLPDDALFKTVCILLVNDFPVFSIDLDVIYLLYGHCELLNFLLHCDIIIESNDNFFYILPRMLYEFKENLTFYDLFDVHFNKYCSGDEAPRPFAYEMFMGYSVSPQRLQKLISQWPVIRDSSWPDADCEKFMSYISSFPKLPKLVDLARIAARDNICAVYSVKNSRQYYTIVYNLYIPEACKKLLRFEVPLYESAEGVDKFNFNFSESKVRRALARLILNTQTGYNII